MSIRYIKCTDINRVGQQVGQLLINQVKREPHSSFILATGSSPITTYKILVQDHQINHTDWSKTTTFNLDEYLGLNEKYAQQSYRYFMDENLFNHINIDKARTYFPNQSLIGSKYQELMQRYPRIAIAILGVGNNGHIAFNEPGTPIDSWTHIVNLTASSRQANARFFDNDIHNVPTQAVTMGLKEILQANQIILIATGKAKSEAIQHLKYAQKFDPNWPITALTLHNDVIVFTDALID